MKILFRVDASTQIGTGHVARCLTLAKALAQVPATGEIGESVSVECCFICQDLPGHWQSIIEQAGFVCFLLPAKAINSQLDDAAHTGAVLDESLPADLLIIDHYALDETFSRALRKYVSRVMVIDDLANRNHECDLLLDQNLFADMATRYEGRMAPTTRQLLGPKYALIRKEFYEPALPREDNRVLVSFGGADVHNLTGLTLNALLGLKESALKVDMVVGHSYPWTAELSARIAALPWVTLHIQCNYMAKLMQQASIMVGSGGTTHWERCITGLPGIIITVADNQQATTRYLSTLGACNWLGEQHLVTQRQLQHAIQALLGDSQLQRNMSETARRLVPKAAGTAWVINEILALIRGHNE